jgi:hypothetical protein
VNILIDAFEFDAFEFDVFEWVLPDLSMFYVRAQGLAP